MRVVKRSKGICDVVKGIYFQQLAHPDKGRAQVAVLPAWIKPTGPEMWDDTPSTIDISFTIIFGVNRNFKEKVQKFRYSSLSTK